MRALPAARAAATEPAAIRSSKETISALMKPFWKSVWITPAASGAVAPIGISQARDSFGPAVRKVCRPRARKPALASVGRPRLAQACLGQQLGCLLVGQLSQVGLGLRVQEDRLGRRDQAGQLLAQP